MTPASGREPLADGSPVVEIDLAAAGAAMDMRSRPAREVDLKDIVPLRAIALRNDHQLQLILRWRQAASSASCLPCRSA